MPMKKVWCPFAGALVFLVTPRTTALSSWNEQQVKDTDTDLLPLDSWASSLHADLPRIDDPIDDDPEDPMCSDRHSNRYDPLACWLWKLKVDIEDQEFKKSIFTVKVQGLSCSNFVVDSIDSAYIPSNKSLASGYTSPSIDLAVKGISATCTGKYHVTGGASGNVNLTASSEDSQPAIHLTSVFDSSYEMPNSTSKNTSEYWMPNALTSQCESQLEIENIRFTGSISARIVDLFSGMIKGSVASQLNEILCPKIQEAVDPLATDMISSVVHALTKYLPKDNSTNDAHRRLTAFEYFLPTTSLLQANAQPTTIVNLEKDTPILVNSLHSVNHFLDCFYGEGNNVTALQKGGKSAPEGHNCTSLVTRGLKGLLSTLLGALAEDVHFPIPEALHRIDFELPKYGRVLLDIQTLHIAGLDQLNGLSLLSPLLDQQPVLSDFRSRIRTGEGINVTADVNITVFAIPGGIIHGGPLHEAFHVHLNVSSLNASGTLGLALKSDQFKEIEIGTIMDAFPGIFHHSNSSHNSSVNRRCLIDAVESLYVKDMELETFVEAATFVPRQNKTVIQRRRLSPLTEELEKDLDDLINHGLVLLLREYQPLLTDAASGFVHNALVSKINHWIDTKLNSTTIQDFSVDRNARPTWFARTDAYPTAKGVCGGDEGQPRTKLVNFTTLTSLKRLNEYVNKPSSLASINNALDNLASKLEKSHENVFASTLTSLVPELQNLAMPGVSVKIRDIKLDHIGSIQHLDVLSPELDGLRLKNGFSMGVTKYGTATNDASVLPRLHTSIEVLYRPRNLLATLNATISLGEIFLDGGSILRFDMTRLRRLMLVDLFSRRHCFIVPFQEHRIYNHHNISRIGTLLANASVSVIGGGSFQNFSAFMDTTTYPSAAALIRDLVGWTMDTLQQILNSAARSSFEQAEGYCTGGQEFGFDDDPPKLSDDYTDELLFPVLAVFSGIFVVVQAVYIYGRRKWRVASQDSTFSNDDVTSYHPLLPLENEENESDSKDGEAGPGETLVNSRVLSAFSRQAVPVLIVGTIVLLISSNISSGATVDLEIAWENQRTINLPAIFTFSLLNTARDMWQAKIYPLFFLVLIMSGIWPYVKLLLMLGSWISPTHVLKPSTRERLLLALDALGKFALIDFLLFVLMMVAFRYHLDVTDTLSVDVFVSPETGFYSFLAATCFSLVVGHFMVYCHRQSEMRHLSPRQSTMNLRESVLNHKYIVGYSNEGEQRLKLSRKFRGFVLFAAVLAATLLSIGISLKSFKFEFGGIAGDLIGDKNTARYSLASIGASLRRSVKEPSIGITVLELTYYFYAVVMPFVCLGTLVILLLVPMTLPTQRRILALAEIANAWSAVEVFVIAIIASLLEISTFASFIVGHRCDLIKEILKEYFASAISDESDATCFTVRSLVETSSWVLVLGALMNSLVVSLLLRFAHCSVAERIQSEMESSLAQPNDDALCPDESGRPATIAGLLSWGCFRGMVFEGEPRSGPSYGYLPQSTDTYSITPDVVWEDESTLGGGHHLSPGPPSGPTSPGRPNGPTNESVLRTMQEAFG